MWLTSQDSEACGGSIIGQGPRLCGLAGSTRARLRWSLCTTKLEEGSTLPTEASPGIMLGLIVPSAAILKKKDPDVALLPDFF